MELPLQVPNETLNQHYTGLLNLRSSVLRGMDKDLAVSSVMI